jgi:hypothetical protein
MKIPFLKFCGRVAMTLHAGNEIKKSKDPIRAFRAMARRQFVAYSSGKEIAGGTTVFRRFVSFLPLVPLCL